MVDTRGTRAFIKTPLPVHTALVKTAMLVGHVPAGTIMYDSTNLFSIPTSAKAVASYLTGFPQSSAAWARFDGKLKIHIVQRNGFEAEGDVLDVESGAATPSDCAPFIAAHKKVGYGRPTIYTSVSNVPVVRRSTGKYVLGVDWDLWVAGWTGSPHVGYPGAVATQYASHQSFDLSVIHDATWPHRGTVAPPNPKQVGPFKQVMDGTLSFEEFCGKRKGKLTLDQEMTTVMELTLMKGLEDKVGEAVAFVDYLTTVGAKAKMPKGLVLFTKNP